LTPPALPAVTSAGRRRGMALQSHQGILPRRHVGHVRWGDRAL